MNRNLVRVFLILVVVCAVVLFFAFDLERFMRFSYLKAQKEHFTAFYENHVLLTIGIYMGIYILVTALSLPGAAVMTLAGGAIFGLLTGTVVVSFASTIGATLAFLVARFVFRDYVQTRFRSRLSAINRGMEKDGAFYLFTLRLVPVFPFFVINLAMALTPIRTITFCLVSQAGMLPGTMVYVNAGAQLGELSSMRGILSFDILLSFALLGIFPLIAKKAVNMIRKKKVLSGWKKPKSFDYNMVVIGAGSAGLVSAYIASAVKAGVALIEKNKMGGDCLNTGCVPSKALLHSAKMLSHANRAQEFGLKKAEAEYDFADIMARVKRIIKKIAPHDSRERYTALGVDCMEGEAKITSPYTVSVNGKTLAARSIVVATGAGPLVPPIPGLEQVNCLTSDNLWEMTTIPERLVVLGGGPIGCEMSQCFARLGAKVTQVEMADRILGKEDPEFSAIITDCFQKENIRVLTGHKAEEVRVEKGNRVLVCKGEVKEIPFDAILVAVGRKPNTKGFGLEEVGVEFNPDGTVRVDARQKTRVPTIFAVGDAAGPYQFTHTAAHQAWYASVNALFGRFKSFSTDYRVIPWCTFTDPEVARVGLNETEAKEKGIDFHVTTFSINELDRAICESEERGLVKVLTRQGRDKILGVTICGAHAGDTISEFVLAMKHNLGLSKILGTIHIYPTFSEANRYAAGNWKKKHAPEKLLYWIEKYHRFMRR